LYVRTFETAFVTTPEKKSGTLTRRAFIRSAATASLAAAAFPSIIPSAAWGQGGAVSPANRLNVGVIGCGPQGRGVMNNFLNEKDCRIAAVCDVKTDQGQVAQNVVNKRYGNNDCRTHRDFRELVTRKDIDALLIASPDHWHVVHALAAVRAGKDIYLEKPLALSVEEGQALRKAVRKHKRVFQFGTQQRSGRMFRLASMLARNGRIGELRHINVWALGSTPGGSLKQTAPIPGMDFDFWLGPAPEAPYTENLCTHESNRKTWWFISQYTLGFLSGWGVHPLDIAAWGGGDLLGGQVEVQGRANFRNAEGICDTATVWDVDFKFSSGVTMKFVGLPNGENRGKPTGDPSLCVDEWKVRYRRIDTHGTAFEGSDGWVHVDRSGINLEPEDLIDINPADLPTQLVQSPGHVRNFLDCIKTRADTVAPIEAAVVSDILCHLADTATRLGRKVRFDFKTERFVNDDTANQRLKARPMRKPWTL
jgi:predicted dehydrogenase